MGRTKRPFRIRRKEHIDISFASHGKVSLDKRSLKRSEFFHKRTLCTCLSQVVAWVRDLLKSDRLWTNLLVLRDLLPKRSLNCKRSLNQAIAT